MRNRGIAWFLVILAIAACLVGTFFGTRWLMDNYVLVGWRLYPQHRQTLDLRGKQLSADHFDILTVRLGGTQILWDVTVDGNVYHSDVKEITVQDLTDEDVRMVGYLTQLKTLHAEDCQDYEQLMAIQNRNPKLKALYSVTLSQGKYNQDTTKLTLTKVSQEDALLMAYLPNLTSVDASACRDYPLLQQMQSEHPEWNLKYQITIAGEVFTSDERSLTVVGADYDELATGLKGMPKLQTVMVEDPEATADQLIRLRQDFPEVDVQWGITINDELIPSNVEELDLSGIKFADVQEAEEIAAYYPDLEKLVMCDCGIDNETMAAFREEKREDYKVVWRIVFTKRCSARTDDVIFFPYQQGESYFLDRYTHDLMYCEDMQCIDLGHHPVKNVDFLAYMPHLKYLILAWTQVEDITAISNCKELIYLEIDHGIVHDYSPLLGCTALEDLNINDPMWHPSLEPLTEMTWLKTLWMPNRSYADREMMTAALPDTRVVTIEIGSNSGQGWRNLQNYYDMRDMLHADYMA